MKMHKYKSEEEFGKDVKEILELMCFKVYSEVNGNDIVIKKGSKIAILELKLNVSDVLLEQLHNRRFSANVVIGIVPYKKSNGYGNFENNVSDVKYFYIQNKEIAILYIKPKEIIHKLKSLTCDYTVYNKKTYYWGWSENFKLKEFKALRHHCYQYMHERGTLKISKDKELLDLRKNDILNSLRDYQLTSNPGCVSEKMLSSAKHSCNLILEYLRKHPKCSCFKEVWDKVGDLHWASYNSMTACLKVWKTKSYVEVNKFMDRRKKNKDKKGK